MSYEFHAKDLTERQLKAYLKTQAMLNRVGGFTPTQGKVVGAIMLGFAILAAAIYIFTSSNIAFIPLGISVAIMATTMFLESHRENKYVKQEIEKCR